MVHGMYEIVIHHRNGSFSDRWLAYCNEHNIRFKIINVFSNDLVKELGGTKTMAWHWMNKFSDDLLSAKRIISGLEAKGIKIFPNNATCWHYDDKIAQKYLLESVEAPLVPTFIFYHKEEALQWLETASYPLVWKLSRGAGSVNVKLLQNRVVAMKYVRKAFTSGFLPARQVWHDANTRLSKHRKKGDLFAVVKRLPRTVRNIFNYNKLMGREIGYVYFQEFIPGNTSDTRVTVIGNRAFAFQRKVRPGDFRASGSGLLDYAPHLINNDFLRIAFEVTARIGAQSLAFDFIRTLEGVPKIIEISYCYVPEAVYECPGHWDQKLQWHPGKIWPQDAILEDLLSIY